MADWMENLERLGDLRDKRLITEEEFEAERNKLLSSTGKPFSKEEETTNTSPQTNTGQPPPPGSSNQQFQDRDNEKEIPKSAKWNLSGLSGFLTTSLILLVVMHVWRIVTHAQRWSIINDLLNGEYVSYSSADAADNNVIYSFGTAILINVIWLVVMIIWAWRATDNLEHWNKNPKWGKGWAIGGWFTVGICIQIFSALAMVKAIRQISDRHAKAALP
jgi:hypothetical protein